MPVYGMCNDAFTNRPDITKRFTTIATAAYLKAVAYKADAAVEFRINPLLLPGC